METMLFVFQSCSMDAETLSRQPDQRNLTQTYICIKKQVNFLLILNPNTAATGKKINSIPVKTRLSLERIFPPICRSLFTSHLKIHNKSHMQSTLFLNQTSLRSLSRESNFLPWSLQDQEFGCQRHKRTISRNSETTAWIRRSHVHASPVWGQKGWSLLDQS